MNFRCMLSILLHKILVCEVGITCWQLQVRGKLFGCEVIEAICSLPLPCLPLHMSSAGPCICSFSSCLTIIMIYIYIAENISHNHLMFFSVSQNYRHSIWIVHCFKVNGNLETWRLWKGSPQNWWCQVLWTCLKFELQNFRAIEVDLEM